MAKKSKRIAKAIGAGIAAYGLSKMMGKELPVSGKDSEVGAVLAKKVSPRAGTYDEAGMETTSAMMDKIKTAKKSSYGPSDAMMKRRQAVRDFEEVRRKTGVKSGFEFMGFSKGGSSVMARGCKLGRKKKTKIY